MPPVNTLSHLICSFAGCFLIFFFLPQIQPAFLQFEMNQLRRTARHDQVFTLVIQTNTGDLAKQNASATHSNLSWLLCAHEPQLNTAFYCTNSKNIVVAASCLQLESAYNSHIVGYMQRSWWRRKRNHRELFAYFLLSVLAHKDFRQSSTPAEVSVYIRATGTESYFSLATTDNFLGD